MGKFFIYMLPYLYHSFKTMQPDLPQLEKYFQKMIDVFHPADEVFLKTGSELFHWYFDDKKDRNKCLEYGKLILPTLRYTET